MAMVLYIIKVAEAGYDVDQGMTLTVCAEIDFLILKLFGQLARLFSLV
jgi:hypothetical protein